VVADSTSVVVDIRVTTEPCPAQKAAWAALWQLIWADKQKSPAPAATETGLQDVRVPDALTDHDCEVAHGRSE
jgi:hypothetical protein